MSTLDAPEKVYAWTQSVCGVSVVEARLTSAEAIERRKKLQCDGMGDSLSSAHTYVRFDLAAAQRKRLEDRIEALREGLEIARSRSNDGAYDQILKALQADDAAVEAE